ncbi:hypothetical protein [Maricaulis sp.]|uniref:hypothetical protein n=1 Tax=Maricaulis sp. TaxID=1486257 RepID=UPI002B27AB2E|nr:hypothetical protein [Maricaulis sp.]
MSGLFGLLAGTGLLLAAQNGGEPLICPAPSAFDLHPTGYQLEFGSAMSATSGDRRYVAAGRPLDRRTRLHPSIPGTEAGETAGVETDAGLYSVVINQSRPLETEVFLRVLYGPSHPLGGDIICVYSDGVASVNLVLDRQCQDAAPGQWRTSLGPYVELECDESRTDCVFSCQD